MYDLSLYGFLSLSPSPPPTPFINLFLAFVLFSIKRKACFPSTDRFCFLFSQIVYSFSRIVCNALESTHQPKVCNTYTIQYYIFNVVNCHMYRISPCLCKLMCINDLYIINKCMRCNNKLFAVHSRLFVFSWAHFQNSLRFFWKDFDHAPPFT